MVIWSCTIFQINVKCQPFAENLLTASNSSYVYETWNRPNDESEELQIYIDSISNSELGTTIDLQFDRLSPAFYVRDKEPQRFRVTARMGVQIFKVQGWPSLIGTFGQYDNALDLKNAFITVYREKTNSKDTPLFRGWTVKLMWYEAQKSKGETEIIRFGVIKRNLLLIQNYLKRLSKNE